MSNSDSTDLAENSERAAFEAWFSDGGQSPKAVQRSGDGYLLAQAQSAWGVWQARAALAAVRTHVALSGDPAPPHKLPTWHDCALLIHNSDFRKSGNAERLEGPISPEPTELHRFIYEYDDADPYRSAWFLHRLELVLSETVGAKLAEVIESGDHEARIRWILNPLPTGSILHEGQP
jgi:hypothetical protein